MLNCLSLQYSGLRWLTCSIFWGSIIRCLLLAYYSCSASLASARFGGIVLCWRFLDSKVAETNLVDHFLYGQFDHWIPLLVLVLVMPQTVHILTAVLRVAAMQS